MKIAITGCCGRMGLTLIKAVKADTRFTLVAGSERPGCDAGRTKAALAAANAAGLFVTSDATQLVQDVDAVIDFSVPEYTLEVAKAVAAKGKIHIIGTTGFSKDEQKLLTGYAANARIVQSGNFSLGVGVLEKLVEQAAGSLSESYDIEISEMHHRHKKDAPSGTALLLGRAAARGRGVSLDDKKVVSRDGMTGERKEGDIGFSVQRGGDVVGIHTVSFAGTGEIIELRHQGFSRDIYAAGALHCALWARDKKSGLYSLRDVLG